MGLGRPTKIKGGASITGGAEKQIAKGKLYPVSDPDRPGRAEHPRKTLGFKCGLCSKEVLGKASRRTPKVGAHSTVCTSKPTQILQE